MLNFLLRVVFFFLGLVFAASLAVAVLILAAVWGVLLSPRRRIGLPIAVRVASELVLFAAAGALLAASGLVLLGVLLVAAELLVLGPLHRPDKHAL